MIRWRESRGLQVTQCFASVENTSSDVTVPPIVFEMIRAIIWMTVHVWYMDKRASCTRVVAAALLVLLGHGGVERNDIREGLAGRQEFCHSAAPPSPFSRRFNTDAEGGFSTMCMTVSPTANQAR